MEAIFGSQGDVTLLQECARAVLILVFGLLLVRLFGRRMMGKWAAPDVIVSLLVGSGLSRALTGNAPLLGTLAATLVLMVLYWLVAHAAARWRFASRLVEGRQRLLVNDGHVDADALRRHAVSRTDLQEALRFRSVATPEGAAQVWLEPSGKLTVVRKR